MAKKRPVQFSDDGISGQAISLPPYGSAADPLNAPSHSAHHAALHNAVVAIDTALSGGAGWNAGTATTAAGDGIVAAGTVLSVDPDGQTIIFDAGVTPAKKIMVGNIDSTQVIGLDSLLATKADKTVTMVAGLGLLGGGTLAQSRTFNVGVTGPGLTLSTDAISLNTTHTDTLYLKKANDTATGNLSMGGFHLNQLVSSGILLEDEAAPVWFVDQMAFGVDPHEAVVAATSIDDGVINIASAPGSIDAVLLVIGNRVLLRNQWNPAVAGDRPAPGQGVENGLYIFNGVGQPLTRAPDAAAEGDLRPGSIVFVQGGTKNEKNLFVARIRGADVPWTPDVDDTYWYQYTSKLELDPGAGLTLTGNILDVRATDETGTANGVNSIFIAPDSIHVADGGIGTVKIKDGAVTANKLYAPIDALLDVDTLNYSPIQDDVLTWDGTLPPSGQWIPKPAVGGVDPSISMIAGLGLTGGGNLTATRTFNVGVKANTIGPPATGGIKVTTNAVEIDFPFVDTVYSRITHQHTLDNLSDVDATAPNNGDTIVWDSTLLKWKTSLSYPAVHTVGSVPSLPLADIVWVDTTGTTGTSTPSINSPVAKSYAFDKATNQWWQIGGYPEIHAAAAAPAAPPVDLVWVQISGTGTAAPGVTSPVAKSYAFDKTSGQWWQLGSANSAVKIIAGVGLTGGGDLTVDRTLTVDQTIIASQTWVNDKIRMGLVSGAPATLPAGSMYLGWTT